jgi:hypothetical protein
MDFAYPKCKNILIDVQSIPYKNEVLRYLDLISTVDVGRSLYKFLGATTKTVRITWTLGMHWGGTGVSQFTKADTDRIVQSALRIQRERRISIEDAVTAATNEDAIMQAKFKGQFAKGHPVMREFTLSILEAFGLHSSFMLPTKDIGTGAGIDVELNYHPAAFRQIIKNTGRIAPGFGPGEALYHELVHAQRSMAGLFLDENVPEHWNMDSFEEFCGILAANMYRSARGFTTFRYDHRVKDDKAPWRGGIDLPGELADPRRYYQAFKPEIVKWFNTQRAFCVALAESCAPFNPMAVAADDLGIAFARC